MQGTLRGHRNSRVVAWARARPAAETAFTLKQGQCDVAAAKRERFLWKDLLCLVVAFNIAIQTKPFLCENSLNYCHLKIGLAQASLITFQFCFLQILAAIETVTQPVLVVGGRGIEEGASSVPRISGTRTCPEAWAFVRGQRSRAETRISG